MNFIDEMDFMENLLQIKLYDYQKEILKNEQNRNTKTSQ